MTVKLSEILKQQGLFSQDIKVRFKNKQISLNGEAIGEDVELDAVVVENKKKDVTGVPFVEQREVSPRINIFVKTENGLMLMCGETLVDILINIKIMELQNFDFNEMQPIESASTKVAKMKLSHKLPLLAIICKQNELNINNGFEFKIAKVFLVNSLTQN